MLPPPPRMIVPATKPLKITGANQNHIFGGKTGVGVDVQTPCWTAHGVRLIRCRRVFIYIVSIGKRVILGCTFSQRYRLALLPDIPYPVPLEVITIGSWSNRLQYRPDTCAFCMSLQCCPEHKCDACRVAVVQPAKEPVPPVLCTYDRHPECRIHCKDRGKSRQRSPVVS